MLTAFCSCFETNVLFRNWRFLFVVFDVRMWLRYAFARLTFPDAVNLNRFLAPLRDFIFGIRISFRYASWDFGSCFFFRSGAKIMIMLFPSM